jgi:glycosyltransferase involved in cell wall biosynthesis
MGGEPLTVAEDEGGPVFATQAQVRERGGGMTDIVQPYLLSVCVPVKIDSKGKRWCDELWAKDLALHLDYIKNLTLICPRTHAERSTQDVSLNEAPFDRITFVDLPEPKSRFQAFMALPELVSTTWAAIKENAIVHTGFGGWPIAEGWIVVPLARLQRKFVLTNVESSPWRVDTSVANWSRRARAALVERANRLCVKMANLRFFTSAAYRRDFLGPDQPRAYVVPATWIDQAFILSDSEAEAGWASKVDETKVIFIGRLTEAKGLSTLFRAIEAVSDQKGLSISILGEGPMRTECEELARRSQIPVSLLGQVSYGPDFFGLLRGFDAVVVPSVSDEQPRVIFDAFSQAVPVIGSDTGGIREIVSHEGNGLLFEAADAPQLAKWLRWSASHRSDLKTMGLSALKKSRQFTHRGMHEARGLIIAKEIRGDN